MQKFRLVFEKCVSGKHDEFHPGCHGPGAFLFHRTDDSNSFIYAISHQIRNEKTRTCLEVTPARDASLSYCHGTGGTQAFVYTADQRILATAYSCLAADLESTFLYATNCLDKNENIHWEYDEQVCELTAFKWLHFTNQSFLFSIDREKVSLK